CVLLNSNSSLAHTVIPDLYKIVEDIYGTDATNTDGGGDKNLAFVN
ncbi:hypothetical protein LCGC14_2012680, partial [marine sediment metagenome]